MKKRGRPPKNTISCELSRQDNVDPVKILPDGQNGRRPNQVNPGEITTDDIAAIEAEACARQPSWGIINPERLIAAVIKVMGGKQ